MKLTERGPEYESVDELLICQFYALVQMLVERQAFGRGYTEQQIFEELNLRTDHLRRNELADAEDGKQAREIWERAQELLRRRPSIEKSPAENDRTEK